MTENEWAAELNSGYFLDWRSRWIANRIVNWEAS